jgi:nucleoid-associated protein YgaU
MKKFSTAGITFAFAATLGTVAGALLAPLPAQAADEAANRAVAATRNKCAFRADAPDQHMVVPGNTLWGISGRFLQHPWCWPQVWDINRDQIRNPHWIYPGQIVYFDRAAGRLRLGNQVGGGTNGNLRLSPQVRSQDLAREPIPSIPANVIEPFLTQPLIVEENQLNDAPRIVAASEGRVYLGKDDKAYVRGELGDKTVFQVFRPGRPLKDPATKAILGYEAAYLGIVRLDRAGQQANEAHRFIIDYSKQEIGVGDRLVPLPPTPLINYMPHPPETDVQARVLSVYGGVGNAGQNDVVSISMGRAQGLDIGSVLELHRAGQLIKDSTAKGELVQLPDERYGTLFVFRVFNNISYGLVMQVTDTVQLGDLARSPD